MKFRLEKRRIDEFKVWLGARGVEHHAGKSDNEVLKAWTGTRYGSIYLKDESQRFCYSDKYIVPLLQKFIIETQNAKIQIKAQVKK